jgi:hypothetical protein
MFLQVVSRGLANPMFGVNAAVEMSLLTATMYGVLQLS